jgi:hypothetical protein
LLFLSVSRRYSQINKTGDDEIAQEGIVEDISEQVSLKGAGVSQAGLQYARLMLGLHGTII